MPTTKNGGVMRMEKPVVRSSRGREGGENEMAKELTGEEKALTAQPKYRFGLYLNIELKITAGKKLLHIFFI